MNVCIIGIISFLKCLTDIISETIWVCTLHHGNCPIINKFILFISTIQILCSVVWVVFSTICIFTNVWFITFSYLFNVYSICSNKLSFLELFLCFSLLSFLYYISKRLSIWFIFSKMQILALLVYVICFKFYWFCFMLAIIVLLVFFPKFLRQNFS